MLLNMLTRRSELASKAKLRPRVVPQGLPAHFSRSGLGTYTMRWDATTVLDGGRDE